MTSAMRTLANAYAALLDLGPLKGVAESVVSYMPRIELVKSDDLQVYVLPVSRTKVRTSLGTPTTCASEKETKLQVILYRRYDEGDATDIEASDEIAALAEAIQDASVGLNVGDSWCVGCDMTSGDGRVLDLDELEQRNAYCSVLDVLFREIS